MPCRNLCRLCIHLAFTHAVAPSSVVWSELGPPRPSPPMRVAWSDWSRALSLVREVALITDEPVEVQGLVGKLPVVLLCMNLLNTPQINNVKLRDINMEAVGLALEGKRVLSHTERRHKWHYQGSIIEKWEQETKRSMWKLYTIHKGCIQWREQASSSPYAFIYMCELGPT